MKKIKLSTSKTDISVTACFDKYIANCSTRGLSDATLRSYRSHFKCVARYLDVTMPIQSLQQEDINKMVSSMRKSDMATNTISSYTRTLRAFFNWCNNNDYSSLHVKEFKQEETIKEVYTDKELRILLKKPNMKKCSFSEYRTWVIINFFINCGCRAATVRAIKIQDIDFDENMVLFRHTKTRKVQAIPLCSSMKSILVDYLQIRGGSPTDYLFCTETGTQLSHEALKSSIRRYNNSRGIEKISIHLFRHTFAKKFLLDCNGNAFTLQKLLGHSTLDTTKRYCNLFNADISKNFDSMSPLSLFKSNDRITMK